MTKDLIDFVVLVIIYFCCFYKKWKAQGRDQLLVKTTLYVHLVFVLYFTLMPIIAALPYMWNHAYRPMNLVPFIDAMYGRGDFVRQIVLNVVMTVPFGFLLPLANQKLKFGHVVLATFLLSLGIELIQPLVSGFRSSDITDIITNVAGGIIGYGIYFICKPLAMKILGRVKR